MILVSLTVVSKVIVLFLNNYITKALFNIMDFPGDPFCSVLDVCEIAFLLMIVKLMIERQEVRFSHSDE